MENNGNEMRLKGDTGNKVSGVFSKRGGVQGYWNSVLNPNIHTITKGLIWYLYN